VLVFAAAQPVARAQDAQDNDAERFFHVGVVAFGRGEFKAAAMEFEHAFRTKPHGASIYNAARAWEAAEDPGRAADDYAAAIDAGNTPADNMRDARARLRALEASLGRIDVSAPPGARVSIDEVERGPAPAHLHVAAGAHAVSITFADGRSDTRAIHVGAGAAVPVALDAPAPRVPMDAPPPDASGSRSRVTLRTTGWVTLGGAVLATGTAVALGVSALSAKSQYDASGHTDLGAYDRAGSLRTATNVAWVTAGVLGAAGITLVLVSLRRSPEPAARATSRAELEVSPTGAALRLGF